MSLPSFEETNNPGYDQVFEVKPKRHLFLEFFKALGQLSNRKHNSKLQNSIENSELIEVLIAINHGSILSPTQEEEFTEKLINYQEKVSSLFEALLKDYQQDTIDDKFLIKNIFHNFTHFENSILNYININPRYTSLEKSFFPHTKNLYQEKFNNPDFKRKLFLYWKEALEKIVTHKIQYYNNSHDNSKYYMLPEEYYNNTIEKPVFALQSLLFEKATREEYIDCLLLLKNYPKEFKGIEAQYEYQVKQNSPTFHARQLPFILEKTNLFYASRKLQDSNALEENFINLMVKMNGMPKESEYILKKLYEIGKLIDMDYILLDPEKQFNFKNLYQNRLPELLDNFNNIKLEYRETISSVTGKNAHTLLNESLKDIEIFVIEILEGINTTKLIKLSSTQKYISSIKNKM